jgi:hypothetical protein
MGIVINAEQIEMIVLANVKIKVISMSKKEVVKSHSYHKIELNQKLQTRRLLREIHFIQYRVNKRPFNDAGKYKMYQAIEKRYKAIQFLNHTNDYYNLTELRRKFKFGTYFCRSDIK